MTDSSEAKTEKQPIGSRILRAITEGNPVTVTVLAIFTAIVLGGLLNAITKHSWREAVSPYGALFEGAIFNPHSVAQMFSQNSISTAIHNGYLGTVFGPLSETCVFATPLLLTGLAVALPYQAGMFNIGGTSQWIGGAIVATYLGYGVSLPVFIHVVVCVAGGFAGGAVIGAAVGYLKAVTGAHEVITTIMLNYIMQYLLLFLLGNAMQRPGRNDPISPIVASTAMLPKLFGSGTSLRINVGFLIALACAAAVWWLLSRTTTGFEFRAVGKNPSAARVAGMKVERTWVNVMLIAGGLAGLAGAAVILGTEGSLNSQSYGTFGIDAITVALLGRGRPAGVVWAALLFGALNAGAPNMESQTGTSIQLVQILQALIVMFVAAPPLIRAIYRLRDTKAAGIGAVLSRGWNA